MKIYLENLKWRDHFRDPSVDGRIAFKWILRKQDTRMWTGLKKLKIRSSGGLVEHDNEPLDSMKSREFLD
jgi:hypothetical protein